MFANVLNLGIGKTSGSMLAASSGARTDGCKLRREREIIERTFEFVELEHVFSNQIYHGEMIIQMKRTITLTIIVHRITRAKPF